MIFFYIIRNHQYSLSSPIKKQKKIHILFVFFMFFFSLILQQSIHCFSASDHFVDVEWKVLKYTCV